MPGVDFTVADHFKVLFRDMTDEPLNKINGRNGFFHIGIILMSVVMESNRFPIVMIDAGSSDDRPAEIPADIFCYLFWIAFVGFGIYIESVFVVLVAQGFDLFEGRTDCRVHFIQKSSAESITEKSIVEMADFFPKAVIAIAALGNEAVDVGIPFQVATKCMKNHNKAGSKIFGFINFMEHRMDDAADRMEKTVKQGAIIEKKIPEIVIDSKNAVAVRNPDHLKGHGVGAFHGVLITTGRAEAAVAAERDKFKVTAMNHFFYIFQFGFTGMESVFYDFEIVSKNML